MKARTKIAGLLTGALVLYPMLSRADLIETVKLTPSDPEANDLFGQGVAIDGDVAVVGAFGDDDDGDASGSAYVFERHQGGADNWGQVKKLTASDAAARDLFGYFVSISGDVAVIGARGNDELGSNSGAAYLFERNQPTPNAWGQVAKLTASDAAAGDQFGHPVAVAGDVAVVGAPQHDTMAISDGAAYVFGRNYPTANAWGEVAKLTASDAAAGDFFGIGVAVGDDLAVVGAFRKQEGVAYVFERNSPTPDAWGQVARLTASGGILGDRFGLSVSISGDVIVVGAYNFDDGVQDSGAAYVFEKPAGGWAGDLSESAKLIPSDPSRYLRFGWTVSISGDVILVGTNHTGLGAFGAAYVVERPSGGWAGTLTETVKLTPADAQELDRFGHSVSLSGTLAAIGALNADDGSEDSGAAYIFQSSDPCGDGTCEVVEGCATCPADCGTCSGPCGDGTCGPGESCVVCAADCGACPLGCGDAVCDAAEDCVSCPLDCGACPPVCGDATCESSEDCTSCSADCGTCAPGCGNGTCGGSEVCTSCPADCGSCPAICGDGTCAPGEDCIACPSDCGVCSSTCGDDICDAGEHCVSCPLDCGVCPATCGDGTCVAHEDCVSCPADCGDCPPGCGNGACTSSESCASCPADCGTCTAICGDGNCQVGESCDTCAVDCGSCAASCGDAFCDIGEHCVNCPADCDPCASECGNAACESDEDCMTCAADCGNCPPGCGNGLCGPAEDCSICPLDCGVCP